MLDYVQHLSDFLPGVEAEITKQVKSLLDQDIDRTRLLCIYGLMELADSLEAMSNTDREVVISYLLNKFDIVEAHGTPFTDFNVTQPVGSGPGQSGPIYWSDILGKPIPVTDIDPIGLTTFIKNITSSFELLYINGGNAKGTGFHPSQM